MAEPQSPERWGHHSSLCFFTESLERGLILSSLSPPVILATTGRPSGYLSGHCYHNPSNPRGVILSFVSTSLTIPEVRLFTCQDPECLFALLGPPNSVYEKWQEGSLVLSNIQTRVCSDCPLRVRLHVKYTPQEPTVHCAWLECALPSGSKTQTWA